MRVVTSVLGGCLLAATLASASEGVRQGPVLNVVWSDRQQKATAVRPLALYELRAQLRAAGVSLRTTVWDGRDRDADPDEIHVVIGDTPPPPLSADTMGAVQMTAGQLR